MNMVAMDTYQISCSWKPGRAATQMAGATNITIRTALEITVGQVLPIAWNIDEQLKMNPLATKFHEINISISAPTFTTASSFVNISMKEREANWHTRVSTIMIVAL